MTTALFDDDYHLGFTGTKKGMTPNQVLVVRKIFREVKLEQSKLERKVNLHHGVCIGADRQAHIIARTLGGFLIVGHPPLNPRYRANVSCDILLEEKEYLERDEDIARASDRLVATPSSFTEQRRSGTWTTVRRARKLLRPITIVLPDGRMTDGD